MFENFMIPGTAEADMKAIMETLHTQQDLLQKLYNELDMEREASATATNESLSMILRLQGEKAAMEMEASQYKRIAEEKMFHAQETLETFRELIYQKEMQIASLEFQVQAYRFKLVSLGCKDVGEIESTYPTNILCRTNTMPGGQVFIQRTVRRGCSLPPHFLKDGDEPPVDGNVSGGSSLIPLPETTDLDLAQTMSGDFSTYWQQIKRLDNRVKELSIPKDLFDGDNKLNGISNSYSLHSKLSSSSVYDELRGGLTTRVDVIEEREQLLDLEHPSEDSAAPSKVHDIFEVPEAPNHDEFADFCRIGEKKELTAEAETMPVMPDSVKTVIYGVMDTKNNGHQRTPVSSDVDDIFPKPRDELVIEQFQFKRPDVADFELQQMKRRVKRLEDERIMARQEIACEEDDEKLMLLNDIKDQLNSIEAEIMSWRPKKPPPKKQQELSCLTEALLHFCS